MLAIADLQQKARVVINRTGQGFAKARNLGISMPAMSASRIEQAMARINTAMARIDAARAETTTLSPSQMPSGSTHGGNDAADGQGSARVMTLVNAHEKLREEVADTIGEIDALIEELEA